MIKTDLLNTYALNENVQLNNRLVMAPMTTWSSQADGQVSLEELDYYRHRSSGVGMVITGTTYTIPNGLGFSNQFYAGDDLYIQSLGRLAQAIHMGGAKAVLQIFHAGRMSTSKALGGNQVVSASAVKAERPWAEMPRPLGEKEIYNVLDSFYETTIRAVKAGFDGVEIHGANTYLIQQFFSPHSNVREDDWGGDLERRMRFPIGVVSSVKRGAIAAGAKDFIIGYRLSPEEAEEPGIRLADTLKFVDVLSGLGLSYLSLSLNAYNQKSIVDKTNKVTMGKAIMKVVDGRLPVMGVGGIKDAETADQARRLGYDMVAVGKGLVMDPDWVEHVKAGKAVGKTLKLSQAKELYIPKGLIDRIKEVEGWFPLEP